MRSILFRLRIATTMAAGLTAGCGTSATAHGPSIEVDRATCESRFTTMATFAPRHGVLDINALAVGPDGTVFFTNTDPTAGGLFAIAPSGGAPVRLSEFFQAKRAWVDGDTLWMASAAGGLYSMPTAGGPVMLIGQIPQAPDPTTDNLMPLPGAFLRRCAARLGDRFPAGTISIRPGAISNPD